MQIVFEKNSPLYKDTGDFMKNRQLYGEKVSNFTNSINARYRKYMGCRVNVFCGKNIRISFYGKKPYIFEWKSIDENFIADCISNAVWNEEKKQRAIELRRSYGKYGYRFRKALQTWSASGYNIQYVSDDELRVSDDNSTFSANISLSKFGELARKDALSFVNCRCF